MHKYSMNDFERKWYFQFIDEYTNSTTTSLENRKEFARMMHSWGKLEGVQILNGHSIVLRLEKFNDSEIKAMYQWVLAKIKENLIDFSDLEDVEPIQSESKLPESSSIDVVGGLAASFSKSN